MKVKFFPLLAFALIGFTHNTIAQSKKKVMEVKRSIYIEVPKEDLWKITAEDFTRVDKWISGVNLAKGSGEVLGATRICTPSYKGFSKTTEEIIDFHPTNYFTYQIAEGMPKMVAKATNTWIHEPQNGGTLLTMQVNMDVRGLMGSIMKGPMKKRMNTILQDALEELKLYAESGELHERKVAAMRKFQTQNRK